jgi:hypothetical protein
MKTLALKLAFVSPLLTTLSAIMYTLKFEPMSEGIVVGLGVLIIIATLQCIAYGIILITHLFDIATKKPTHLFI